MKRLSVGLALAGLLIALGLVAWFGADHVLAALSQIGWSEFAVLLVWQIALFVVLGIAWLAIMPPAVCSAWLPVWGRMIRDASATVLPFSQLGGFVLGTRAMTLHGVAWPTATASIVVDVTAEFLAQIVFACLGLGILIARAPSSALVLPLEIGLAGALLGGGGFVLLQRGAGSVFAKLGPRIAGERFANAQERADVLGAELSLIHGHTARLAVGFAVHLCGWLCAGVAGWLTYRALGVRIDFDDAVAIEALLSVIAAVAFLVPLNAGFQEAGYAGLGTIFGVPPEVSIGVSLVRRARDIAVGVPILLIWQWVEVRRLRGAGRV
jgi:putative membrane protein